jgi:hypothetical protein
MIYLYTITRQLPPIVIYYYMSNMRLSNCECFLAIENTIPRAITFEKESSQVQNRWSLMVSDLLYQFHIFAQRNLKLLSI